MLIDKDMGESCNHSLDLSTGWAWQRSEGVLISALFLHWSCKTNWCVCKKLDLGCTPWKWECKPSECCRQREETTVNMNVLARRSKW